MSTSSLGHPRCIEDESFVRSTKNKFNYKLNYLQNILPYIIVECKIHYVSLKIEKEKNTCKV